MAIYIGYYPESDGTGDMEASVYDPQILQMTLLTELITQVLKMHLLQKVTLKLMLVVMSLTTQTIGNDSDAAVFITDLELDTVASYGWSVNTTYGAIENTTDRELVMNTGVTSLHIESSNASDATLYIFSETSSDGGVTWVKNAYSGRESYIR